MYLGPGATSAIAFYPGPLMLLAACLSLAGAALALVYLVVMRAARDGVQEALTGRHEA